MENQEPDFPVAVTARHMDCTDAILKYVKTKLARIHMDYPKIIDAKVVVDHEKHGEKATITLHCSNHITIEADTETRDLYEAIDLTLEKLERQMRKEKTRRQKRLGH